MANNDKHTLAGEMPGNVVFGIQGESAYQVAVRNGFEGTEEEWLKSLSGPAGVGITDMYDMHASQSAAGTQSLAGKRHTLTVNLSDGTVRSFPFKDGDNGQRGRGVYPWDLNASSSFVDDEGITHYRDGVTLPDGVVLLDGDLLLTGTGDVFRVEQWNNIYGMTVKHLYNIAGSAPGSGGNGNQGTGLTSTEKNLMLALFKAVPFRGDVGATMKSLEAIWAGSSSGGETPDIPDDPDIPAVTYYSVAYNLTSVTADSTPASVIEGGSLTVNLTPDTNAVLGEVVVTMGGVDVTATAYSNGKVSISSVTGDVVITATATVASYTQVEYLELTSATGYMVTPVALRPTDLIECVWSNMKNSTWAFPFGAYGAGVHCSLTTRPDGVAGRTAYTRRSGASYPNRNTADTNFVMPSATSAMYRFTESAPGTGTIYDADGNALVSLTDEEVSGYSGNGTVMGLFYIINAVASTPIMHGSSGTAGLRIHSFKITDVYGVATIDLIPVLDADGVACMYDKVSGEYLYDASGANGFIAGGAV